MVSNVLENEAALGGLGSTDQRENSGGIGADRLAPLRTATQVPRADWHQVVHSAVERVRSGGDRRVGFAFLVGAVVVAAGGVVYLGASSQSVRGSSGSSLLPFANSSETSTSGSSLGATASGAVSTSSTVQIIVHAASAVMQPGVYRIDAAARVSDLVALAGGLAPDADVDRVNLAAQLADGARVYVPHSGEQDPPAVVNDATGSTRAAGGPTAGSGTSSSAARINVNTATVDQLDSLPGVGPSTAAAILDYRQRHGPFRSVDELGQVRGIGPSRLAQLRDLVRV